LSKVSLVKKTIFAPTLQKSAKKRDDVGSPNDFSPKEFFPKRLFPKRILPQTDFSPNQLSPHDFSQKIAFFRPIHWAATNCRFVTSGSFFNFTKESCPTLGPDGTLYRKLLQVSEYGPAVHKICLCRYVLLGSLHYSEYIPGYFFENRPNRPRIILRSLHPVYFDGLPTSDIASELFGEGVLPERLTVYAGEQVTALSSDWAGSGL
jgi:hypothetical protein